MVKSMLDLRLLDSFQPGAQEELQEQPEEGQEEQVLLENTLFPTWAEQMGNLTYITQVRTCPFGVSDASSQRRRGPGTEAGLYRTNQELGSTVSLQVTTAWVRHLVQPVGCVGRRGSELSTSDWLLLSFQAASSEGRTNHRPDFIQLSNQSPDLEDHVLYPEQWEDRLSLAERYEIVWLIQTDVNPPLSHNPSKPSPLPVSEFQVKEACPAAAGGRQDKPSPDSGCSLGSSLSSPVRPAADGETQDCPLLQDKDAVF